MRDRPDFTESLRFCYRLRDLMQGFRGKGYQPAVFFPEQVDDPVVVMVGVHPINKLGPMPEYALAVSKWLVAKGYVSRSDSIYADLSERAWQMTVANKWWRK